jgi:hypothetical protein
VPEPAEFTAPVSARRRAPPVTMMTPDSPGRPGRVLLGSVAARRPSRSGCRSR